MLRDDTVQIKLCGKKFFVVLSFFLVMVMMFSTVAKAANFPGYESNEDACLFNYTNTIDFLNSVGGYMLVEYTKDGETAARSFDAPLSGEYWMTANGLYTIRLYKPDGTTYGQSFYQTVVTQVQNDTWNGGSGTFGYDGTTGNTGTDPNDGGSNPDPDPPPGEGGEWFEAPAWDEYMGKIDEIINKLPPPPNWDQVADTFYDRVVPRAINDLENMLGTAPLPPSIPAQIQPVTIPKPSKPVTTDYEDKLNDSMPQMQVNPALDDAAFTADDVRNEAPVIEFREDESGGFDLPSGNPVDSLPELPFVDFPMPGMGDAGEWDHQPIMPDNPFPMQSEGGSGGGSIDPGVPPIPSSGRNEAPLPGQEYNAPLPDGVEIGVGNYKLHPDDEDGSG